LVAAAALNRIFVAAHRMARLVRQVAVGVRVVLAGLAQRPKEIMEAAAGQVAAAVEVVLVKSQILAHHAQPLLLKLGGLAATGLPHPLQVLRRTTQVAVLVVMVAVCLHTPYNPAVLGAAVLVNTQQVVLARQIQAVVVEVTILLVVLALSSSHTSCQQRKIILDLRLLLTGFALLV
jgi:hypothetical protein